jgi:hypothetical protein
MQDGRVLVAGGSVGGAAAAGPVTAASDTSLSSVEIYDPTTETWTAAPPMMRGRAGCQAFLLPDGRVLVIGNGGRLLDGEVYDPATGAWTRLPLSDPPARPFGSADGARLALLRDGRLLFVVWSEEAKQTLVYLYDTATDAWTQTGAPSLLGLQFQMTQLTDGRVLAVGERPDTPGRGFGTTAVPAELYDPATGTWTETGEVVSKGGSLGALIPLPDGRAVLQNADLSTHVYDPRTGMWSTAGRPTFSLGGGYTATALADSRLLIVYGQASQILDSATGSWTAGPALLEERTFHTATLLGTGEVVIAGGSPRQPPGVPPAALASAERYAP